MSDLSALFEQHRPRLRSVAYRMLGSLSEAEDAVQEAWLRLTRSESPVDNLGGWLTTVVARIALNQLRARKTRDAYEPILDRAEGASPEHAALLADHIGLALLVVLDTLNPAERVAFVLHDIFDVPFDEIAAIVQRTPESTRQLASRARRRVHARGPEPAEPLDVQRRVVDAFLTAARDGDFAGLLAVLDPAVVLRRDASPTLPAAEVHGAEQVARGSQSFSRPGLVRHPVLVNGAPGALCTLDGAPFTVMAFTVQAGRITGIHILAQPDLLARIDLTILG